jgi:3-hydroxyisobutyrate dehydrogenase-like beta-hydroxyacid dehydrogenase
LKDVQLMLAAAKKAGASLPLTQIHQELLDKSVQAGRGAFDNSAIIEIFRERIE